MAKYSKKASEKVEKAMRERKKGTLKSGRSGKKVKSRNRRSPSDCPRPGAREPRCPDLSKIESGTVTVDAEDILIANLLEAVGRTFRHEAESRLSFEATVDSGTWAAAS